MLPIKEMGERAMVESRCLSTPDTIEILADISRWLGERSPNVTALSHGDRHITYGELDRYASQVANGLIAAGVKPGGRIAVLDKNSDRFFQLLLGAAKAGVVLVPVNARLAPPEIAFAVNDSEAELFFVNEGFLPSISLVRGELSKVRNIIVLETGYESWRDSHCAADPKVPLRPDLVCLQLYTSGTTGYPKGVQLTHRNFLAVKRSETWRSWSPKDNMLLVMPLFHIAGVGLGIFGLLTGLRIIIHREFVPGDVLRAIEHDRVNIAFLVPAMLLALLNGEAAERTNLSSLKHVIYGASPIPIELLKRAIRIFRHTSFFQVYGLTETAGVITVLGPEDHAMTRQAVMRSGGRAVEGVELRIIGADGR